MFAQNKKSARIYEFRVRNFKGVDVFEYKFENGKLVVFGKNGSAKSSILEGLLATLQGSKMLKQIDDPVGPYGNKATVELWLRAEPGATELGERLFIQFGITEGGTVNLSITDEETGTVHTTSPRTKIDKLVGQFLDPVELKKDIDKPNGARLLAEKLCRMVGLDLEPFVKRETELFELFQ
ncbi:MAG: hypothetical protein GY866_38185, partial [Proteobacteria bacterium]|nr:hypothetical protein [Pseudomonadota bacterium]